MTNVKYVDSLTLDCEEDPIKVWFAPIQKLADFKGKFGIFQGLPGNASESWQEMRWHLPTLRTLLSPALRDTSQSRIASAS